MGKGGREESGPWLAPFGQRPEGRSPGHSQDWTDTLCYYPTVTKFRVRFGSHNREHTQFLSSRQPTHEEALLGHHHTASPKVTRPAKHLTPSYLGDHGILGQRALDGHLAERPKPLGI